MTQPRVQLPADRRLQLRMALAVALNAGLLALLVGLLGWLLVAVPSDWVYPGDRQSRPPTGAA